MKKILFVIGLTHSGGAEKRAILTARLLKKKYETSVFAFSGDKINGVDFVFKSTYSEYKKTRIRTRIKALRDFIQKEKPDFVFSYVPHVNLFASFALKKRCFKNIKHIAAIVFPKYALKNKLILRCSLKRVDCVYYQSEEQKEIMDINKPFFVIPNPIIIPEQYERDCKMKFMSVGRLEEQKGYLLQIRSFAIILARFDNATLDIYGNGTEKQKILDLITELGIQSNVFVHEYTHDIQEQYKKHDIFLFTTKMEGFPNVLAEAMANRMICFSTQFITGCTDLLADKETGFLCTERNYKQYADMVISELNDYQNAKKVAENGYRHVKDICDANNFCDKLNSELEKIV